MEWLIKAIADAPMLLRVGVWFVVCAFCTWLILIQPLQIHGKKDLPIKAADSSSGGNRGDVIIKAGDGGSVTGGGRGGDGGSITIKAPDGESINK
ncbi:MAG: hypothetical protein NTY34_05575 [Candidatus Omnitrophica bacterium]|nr:hypothetical protein [Candidatus Omnitrophota bacterium]